MEGAATTVYAQGGRGNARLVAWEGERTVTFTMEDALISPAGFMILSGAGLVEASADKTIKVHTTEQTADVKVEKSADTVTKVKIALNQKPYYEAGDDFIYVMRMENGEVATEPYRVSAEPVESKGDDGFPKGEWVIELYGSDDIQEFTNGCVVLVDYYVEKAAGASQIDITPDKFGGNYYLEASTLFRDQNGVDMPAEFIIPNCKIQSNFTFSMAASGDPSTFTFTMDAFPDYTRFDKTKKVLAAIQIIETSSANSDIKRASTASDDTVDDNGQVIR
jgi:hypothetical protein